MRKDFFIIDFFNSKGECVYLFEILTLMEIFRELFFYNLSVLLTSSINKDKHSRLIVFKTVVLLVAQFYVLLINYISKPNVSFGRLKLGSN